METPDPDTFRAAMSRFATGVTVMTTTVDDVPHGMTANAVTSVSLDPLLVLVCVGRDTHMAERLSNSDHFALSVLSADQQHVSQHFADASRQMGAEEFEKIEAGTAATGAPILRDGLAWLDCRIWARYDGGDHEIVVGEVVDLGIAEMAPPLLYFGSRYRALADE